MTFTKPSNITFTQMAQWVDANSFNEDCDEQILCQYIYHIVVLKTRQHGLFTDSQQIDDFAIYCVSRFFSRLKNKSEKPVKSVCNYLNIVLLPWKADYLKDFCVGYNTCELADFDLTDFGDYLIDISSEEDFNTYWFDCIKISDILYKYLKRIPKKKNSSEWLNIYTSCLLTLQDRISYALTAKSKCSSRFIRSLKTKPPVLYHIDEAQSNYISTLVNEMIHALCVEISKKIHSKVSPSACMKNLVMAAISAEDE